MVCHHVPSLWHGALSLRRCQRTPPPLSGGFCHAATATSPPFSFFCLIQIQLGTQTMPVSWHILERGEHDNNIRLLPHIRPSTDRHGPMPTCNWVFFFFCVLLLLNSLLAFNTLKWSGHLQNRLPFANSGWPGRRYFYCCCIKLIFAEGRGLVQYCLFMLRFRAAIFLPTAWQFPGSDVYWTHLHAVEVLLAPGE